MSPRASDLVRFGGPTAADEIDLGPGAFILSPPLAAKLRGVVLAEDGSEAAAVTDEKSDAGKPATVSAEEEKRYGLRFQATAAQLFRILPALQNLAERSESFVANVEVQADGREPFDRTWLRNAVEEHLDEAGIDVAAARQDS